MAGGALKVYGYHVHETERIEFERYKAKQIHTCKVKNILYTLERGMSYIMYIIGPVITYCACVVGQKNNH